MIKYKYTLYFVASDEELLQINDLSEIYEISVNETNGIDGFGGFELVFALSRLFFQDEKHIPIKVDKKITESPNVFQYDRDFVEKVSSYERAEMDSFAYRLREDSLCTKFEFVDMGVWVFLYELHDCCSLAVKENKNLYLIEENNEYILER